MQSGSHIKRQRRKYFFYPAGLISLMLLPVLCIWYISNQKRIYPEGGLELSWWAPALDSMAGYHLHPDRKFTDIVLSGNRSEDEAKINNAIPLVSKFVQSEDTVGGIHFHYGDKVQYASMVQMLEVCHEQGARWFTMDYNDLWIFMNPPRPPSPEITHQNRPPCGNPEMTYQEYLREKQRQRKEERLASMDQHMDNMVKTLSVSWVVLLLMGWFGVRNSLALYKNAG